MISDLGNPESEIENPLPPCPGMPNCVRETRHFRTDPDTLFARARAALEALHPEQVEAVQAGRQLDAVFRVLLFRDDFALAVTAEESGAALHVRSASRIGRHDLGVNRRRVARFFRALDARD